MSSLSIDFNNNLSFDLPIMFNNKPSTKGQDVKQNTRNRQCIPSDDEDEEEDEEEDDDDMDLSQVLKSNKPLPRPIRKTCPLPSDDEDEDEEEEEKEEIEGDKKRMIHAYQQPMHQEEDDDDDRAIGYGMFMEGSHLQQLHQKQQHHQQQLAQFQYYQQHQMMSGMDFLKHLEKEKSNAKRTKPKIDSSKVQIHGLLGNLPEPKSHNINFQQQQMKRQSMNYLNPPQAYSRSPSPHRRSPSPHRRSPSPNQPSAHPPSSFRNQRHSMIHYQ